MYALKRNQLFAGEIAGYLGTEYMGLAKGCTYAGMPARPLDIIPKRRIRPDAGF